MQTNWLWGYLIPIGLLLLTWGGLEPPKARRITPLAALALALAVIGYWALGYGLHLGGAYVVNPDPGLQGLGRLYGREADLGLFGMSGSLTWDVWRDCFDGAGTVPEPICPSWRARCSGDAGPRRGAALARHRRRTDGALIAPVAALGLGRRLAFAAHTLVWDTALRIMAAARCCLAVGQFRAGVLLLQPRRPLRKTPPCRRIPPANLALFVGAWLIGWTPPGRSFLRRDLRPEPRRNQHVLGMAGVVFTSCLRPARSYISVAVCGARPSRRVGERSSRRGFSSPWAALIVGLMAGLLFPLCSLDRGRLGLG